MKIAVTGAHGFVGLNVVRALADQGHDVVAIGRREPDDWVLRFLNDVRSVDHVAADVAQPGALTDAVSSHALDAVVHAAVVTATTLEVERDQAARIVHVNAGGTIEALESARAASARRFVYVSSPSAIGNPALNGPIDESVEKRPDSLYGITKDASEEITRRYGHLRGLSVCSVRIAQPYGPGERATPSRVRTSPIYEWLLDAEAGRELPTGPFDRSRDWTYIDDTARGIAMLATASELRHDLYHLSRGGPVSVGEVLREIERAYPGISYNEQPDPDALNPNIAGSSRRKPLDPSRFRDEFGWAPETDIQEGMRLYLDWRNTFAP